VDTGVNGSAAKSKPDAPSAKAMVDAGLPPGSKVSVQTSIVQEGSKKTTTTTTTTTSPDGSTSTLVETRVEIMG
jgi:hypothetical protein